MRRPAYSWSIPIAVCLLATIYFLSTREGLRSFPLDDAWIHQVYARAFATGHGLEYNAGVQEAGATSPLWAIATAPVHWFVSGDSRDVAAAVKFVGVFFGVLSVLLFYNIARHASGSPAVACVAASLLAIEPRLLFASLSGMETTLLLALWLGGLVAMLKRRWFTSASLFALMPVTRPESLLILPLCAVALVVSNREWSWSRRVLPVLVLAVPFSAWAWFCHTTTGHWLPNTYYIKAHPFRLAPGALSNSWHIVSGAGFATLIVFPIGIIMGIIRLAQRRRALELVFLTVAPLIYMTGVAGTRELFPEGYYWTRWLDSVALLLTAVFSLGIALLLCGAVPLPRKMTGRAWRTGVIAASALALVLCAPRFARSFMERRAHLRTDSRVIDTMDVNAGLWIRDNTAADAIVGVNDAGAIRYFGNRRTVDLVGINDQELAFSRIGLADDLVRCNWLAISPSWFTDQGDIILKEYGMAKVIRVTVKEYTICDCPDQTVLAIFQRKDNVLSGK